MKLVKILLVNLLTFICLMCMGSVTVLAQSKNTTKQTIVSLNGHGDYTSIQAALEAGMKNILVKNGVYRISSRILINNAGTKITGESKDGVKIVQTNPADDGLVVSADSVSVSNLTVDCQTCGGTWTAIVVRNSNNVIINNCVVYGSNNGFSVYFSGRSYASDADTIAAVEKNSNLDTNNVMQNCTVYSKSETDGVILALQSNGKLINNTINGSRIAFYMCNSSEVSGNTINNSKTQGIFVSIPAFNNIIKNNTINNCALSAIKVAAELEHTNEAIDNHTYTGTGFTISNNVINNPAYFGLEIDELAYSTISYNKLTKCDYIGIYILRSNNLNILWNNIVDSGYGINESTDSNYYINLLKGIQWKINDTAGIFIDYNSNNNNITDNSINNTTPGCAHAIFANSTRGDSTIFGNIFERNIIQGIYSGTAVEY